MSLPLRGRDLLPDVDCSRGAPMGRGGFAEDPAARVRLFRVYLNAGGYDAGGAYWGVGAPLYCAAGEGFLKFRRAADRAEAKERLLKEYPALRFHR